MALEVEDVFFVNEPIVVRARPNSNDISLKATLWRTSESHPVAVQPLQYTGGDWQGVEFAPLGTGDYRVTITGTDVETVEDSFLVAEIDAKDL